MSNQFHNPAHPDDDDAPAAARLLVGAYLRSLRRGREFRLQDVAPVIRGSIAKVSRIETGTSPQREQDVVALMRHYGVRDGVSGWPLIRAVCHMVNASQHPRMADSAPGWPDRLRAAEQEATGIRVFTMYMIPDILQIPPYTALMPNPEGARTPERALIRGHSKEITVLLDEFVLRRTLGAPEVVAAQLAHLQERVRTGEVRVLVVPLTAGVVASSVLLSQLTLNGHELYVDESGFAFYSTGADGRVRHGMLDAAEAAAESPERSAWLLDEARERMLWTAAEEWAR